MRALEVIEEAASRTLAEMRTMVGVLRDGDEPDRAPQRGVADIERLARDAAHGPRVDVELTGDLDALQAVGRGRDVSPRTGGDHQRDCSTPATRPASTSRSPARTTACG